MYGKHFWQCVLQALILCFLAFLCLQSGACSTVTCMLNIIKKMNLIPSIIDENPTIPKNTYSDSGMSLEKKLCWGKLLHFHFGSADNLRGWPINGRVTFSGSLAEKTSRSLTLVLCPPERSQSQWDGIKTPVKMTMMVNHPYNKALFFLQQKFGIGRGGFNP